MVYYNSNGPMAIHYHTQIGKSNISRSKIYIYGKMIATSLSRQIDSWSKLVSINVNILFVNILVIVKCVNKW